jgi:hypothetical protein
MGTARRIRDVPVSELTPHQIQVRIRKLEARLAELEGKLVLTRRWNLRTERQGHRTGNDVVRSIESRLKATGNQLKTARRRYAALVTMPPIGDGCG